MGASVNAERQPVAHRLAPLFDFSSIAVVGASDSGPAPRGFRPLQILGFTGRYYPVNNRAATVHGMTAYPNVSSLPEVPDMVLVAVPAHIVPGVIDECADIGVKAAVIVSAGFLEVGGEGAELQARITATARTRGPLVVGPNCLGLVSVVNHCCAFDGVPPAYAGNVAVISNSGGLMNETMWTGGPRGIGFSHCVSAGNEAGVTSADLIDYFVADPATDVVLAILETVRDPALFIEACNRARAARKPIVVLKMGRSEKGRRSVTTHTGALAGNDAVYSALFRQLGVIEVNDLDELVDMGALLSAAVPVLRHRRLERAGIIEISGGGKELLCDTCAAAGVELPELSEAGAATLLEAMQNPEYVASNPVDTGGSWGLPEKDRVYPAALEVFATEPEVDLVVSRYTIPRVGELGVLKKRVDEMQVAVAAHPDRLFVVLSRTSDHWCPEWEEAVRAHHIPFLQGYGRGPRALGRLAEYSRLVHGDAATNPRADQASADAVGAGTPLDEVESKRIVAAAGIPVIETALATTADEAVREADRLGYPVVLKVVAPEIVHKSAAGGVRLDLADAGAVRAAFAELKEVAATRQAAFTGVSVQPLAQSGAEIVLGAQRDPQLGPVIMCGLGGVFVEALNDVALRLAPVTAADAVAMLAELRGQQVLAGRDTEALQNAICALSALMLARPDIASIDVNPVLVYEAGLIAVDARVLIEGS